MKFKTYYSNKFIITTILSTLGALLLVVLSQCTEIEQRNDKRDNAIQLKSKIYKTDGVWEQHIEVFEMDGYKVILWENGYGSDMEIIPSDDLKVYQQLSDDYEKLWNENQKFSSMLSEIENEPGGHKILKKLYNKLDI